jgi:hypothetical protein
MCVVLINIPFGYWRSNTRRLSVPWLMAVHIPVPVAIGLRLSFLGWNWMLLPAFVAAYGVGQYTGGRTRYHLQKRSLLQMGSCLATDVDRALSASFRRKN